MKLLGLKQELQVITLYWSKLIIPNWVYQIVIILLKNRRFMQDLL